MRNLLTMIEEIWRDVKDYEGKYEVSNYGRVRSLNYGKERVLQQCKNSCGYLMVPLCKDGKQKLCTVHRLVAEAFIPNPYNLPQVNHINEDKQSNIVTNLEWCNAAYNTNYGTRTERSTKANRNHPAKSKPVYQYTKDGSFIRSYPSTKEIERQTGIHNGSISHCCLGKRKSAGGYVWSFNPPE